MKKTFIYTASVLLLFAASCKENVIPIDLTDGPEDWDSTYVGAVEPAEPRRLLIEELSGVTCVNCPQGAEVLEDLSTQNPNQLSIVTIHTGQFTDPIEGISKQNFQTEDGRKLREQVWFGQGSKPTAIFDRLFLGSGQNKYFIDGYPGWANAIIQDKAKHSSTPVNITVKSTYNDKGWYDIEVAVKYTSAVTAKNALHIFVTESKIIDAQEYSTTNIDEEYEFNHVFRKAITPAAIGKTITASKAAGSVFLYRTSLKIDPSDASQKFWKPENMTVIAFVTDMDDADKHVMHVKEVKL
jgi:thiol-disulfide isomerase/thioredoxin